MKNLNKYLLKFDFALKYVLEDLDEVNTLSIELLKSLDFKLGHFFTLLPDNANFEEVYNFKRGGILPQYPEEQQMVDGYTSTFSWIPDINNELAKLILKEIKLKKELSCVVDKVTGTASEACYTTYFDAHPLFYEKEVYFHLADSNISLDLILKCLKASTSFWHSLCVFTTANFNNINKELSFENINEICRTTKLFMVGAYDGEGYVFWEKNTDNFFSEIPFIKNLS